MAIKIRILLCPICFIPAEYDHAEEGYNYEAKIYKCPKCGQTTSEGSCVEVEQ